MTKFTPEVMPIHQPDELPLIEDTTIQSGSGRLTYQQMGKKVPGGDLSAERQRNLQATLDEVVAAQLAVRGDDVIIY